MRLIDQPGIASLDFWDIVGEVFASPPAKRLESIKECSPAGPVVYADPNEAITLPFPQLVSSRRIGLH